MSDTPTNFVLISKLGSRPDLYVLYLVLENRGTRDKSFSTYHDIGILDRVPLKGLNETFCSPEFG